MERGRLTASVVVVAALSSLSFFYATPSIAATTGHASGSASFDKHSTTIRYGWLVRGPDEFDHTKSIYRIYLAATDVGAKIQACNEMSCADESLDNGCFIDYDGSNVNFWLTLESGHVQFSGGGSNTEMLTLTTKAPDHLAGKVHIDESSFHGATILADFDLPLFKTFKK